MTVLRTRVVGPWWSKADRDRVYEGLEPGTRRRAARRRFGGAWFLELYPSNPEGEPVDRAWPPRGTTLVPALPALAVLTSPNQGQRTAQVEGVVVHETEGAYLGAVSWLRNPSSDASAHLVLREDGRHATQLVPWSRKAWHASGANSHTLGLEIAGKTATVNNREQVMAAVRIVAFWCHLFRIPARFASDRGYGGITTHRALGAFGGGHGDPGGFDMERFVLAVRRQVEVGRFPRTWGVR